MTSSRIITVLAVLSVAPGMMSCGDNVRVGTAATTTSAPPVGGAAGSGGSDDQGAAGRAGTGGASGMAAGGNGGAIAGAAGSGIGGSAGTPGAGGGSAGIAGAGGEGGAGGPAGNGGLGGASGKAGGAVDPSVDFCPPGTPVAPAVWGVAVDPSTFPGIATDGVSEIFIVESAQTKTSLLLASCSDATFGGIAKHDLLLVRLGPDGTCLWSRWLAKDASALPNDDGPHRIAATANMVVVRMASSLVGLHDDGTMAWTVPFDADFFPDVLASESDFIVFSTGPTVIVLQHLSTAGALGPKLTFALADAAGAANVDVAVAADGTAVIHGNTDVAIPDLGVPAPPPNFDTVFAAALSPSGSVTWTKTFPDHTNLGGEELETAVLLAGDKVWVATLAPDPSDGNTLWIRAADGSWTSTDYPHVYLGPFAALPDGTLVVAAALPQQAVVAPLTGCAWLDTIGPLPPQGDVDTLLRLGNDLLVSGFFWTGSLSAQPPCGGPTSIDFAGRTFSAACSGRFLARVSP